MAIWLDIGLKDKVLLWRSMLWVSSSDERQLWNYWNCLMHSCKTNSTPCLGIGSVILHLTAPTKIPCILYTQPFTKASALCHWRWISLHLICMHGLRGHHVNWRIFIFWQMAPICHRISRSSFDMFQLALKPALERISERWADAKTYFLVFLGLGW